MHRAALLLALGLASVAVRAQTEPWTLARAVEHALATSPDARLATARVLAAEAAAVEVDAQRLPRVDLRVTYLQTDNPMQAFGAILNQGTFDNRIDFNAPGHLDAFSAALEARYALFSGGRITAQREAARALQSAAAQDREAALNRLGLEVVRSIFAIRQAAARVGAFEAALASYEENLRIGRLREAAGELLASERLNLEVERAQTAEQHLAARHMLRLAERRFAFLLGLRPNTEIVLADDDPTVERLTVPDADTLGTYRPELAALQRRVDAAERQVRAARAGRLPSVGAFASVQADRGWRRDGSGESWTAGVSAELPVFDGSATRARIRAAEAQAETNRQQLAQAELALALELEQAQLALALAREQVAVTTQTVAQAEEAARLSRQRFAAGALLSAELIAVETRLADVRVRRTSALAQERIAVAELRRAAGLPLFD